MPPNPRVSLSLLILYLKFRGCKDALLVTHSHQTCSGLYPRRRGLKFEGSRALLQRYRTHWHLRTHYTLATNSSWGWGAVGPAGSPLTRRASRPGPTSAARPTGGRRGRSRSSLGGRSCPCWSCGPRGARSQSCRAARSRCQISPARSLGSAGS